MQRIFVIVLLILGTPFFNAHLFAQVEGLWMVESVSMGDQSMTPVAKWTRIHPDHSYQSGNGWLQNSEGSWTYQPRQSLFIPVEKAGLEDPFGPFKVRFKDTAMIWEREEEGELVEIVWQPIRKLPKAPSDQIVGLWQLEKPGGEQSGETLFLRWDKIFVRAVNGDRGTGYWFMNAHRPELELIPHGDGESLKWMVTQTIDSMTWVGNSTLNMGEERHFKRLRAFP